MKPPRIIPPGRGQGRNIPGGYILGRTRGARSGAVQLLDLQNLAAMGVGTVAGQTAASSRAGFGFSAGGTLKSGELLGTGVWARAVTFGTGSYSITSLIPAHASATFILKAIIAGVPTQVGSFVFAAGGKSATLTWSPTPYTNPAGTPLQLIAPTPNDANLASLTGIVNGVGH